MRNVTDRLMIMRWRSPGNLHEHLVWLTSCYFQDAVFVTFGHNVPRCGSEVILALVGFIGCLHSCISSNLGSFQALFLQQIPLPLSLFLLRIPWCTCWFPKWCLEVSLGSVTVLQTFPFCSSDMTTLIVLYSSSLILSNYSYLTMNSP